MYSMAPVKIRRTYGNMGMVYIHGATMYDTIMSGQYFNNIPLELKAEPKPGYSFIKWEIKKKGVVTYKTSALIFDTLNSSGATDSIYYTAIFNYTPDDIFMLTVNSGSGSGLYAAGSKVQVTAKTPATGKEFDAWTGDISLLDNPKAATATLTMAAASATVTATYRNATGIDGEDNYPIQLYPNPVADHLEVLLPENTAGVISISKVTGEIVLTHTFQSNFATLEMTDMSPGLYLITVSTTDRIITKTFIKN